MIFAGSFNIRDILFKGGLRAEDVYSLDDDALKEFDLSPKERKDALWMIQCAKDDDIQGILGFDVILKCSKCYHILW